MKALIVEDEKTLAFEIETYLSKAAYICDLAFSFSKAVDFLEESTYDYVLIDLGLPDGDGLNLLTKAKKLSPDAVYIILTARDGLDDRLAGLNNGADDYLPKPFFLPELLARMQAIARRKFNINSDYIVVGDFKIDLNKRLVLYGEVLVDLSKKEYDLLSYLILHKNMVLSRMQLADHIWGTFASDDYDSNFIDAHIKNLRKKLNIHAPTLWLETARGLGYRVKI